MILDRGRRFLDPPAHFHAFCSHDHSINKDQRATVLHLIFAFLSCLLVKAPKNFERQVYICCYHLLQNQVHENAQKPLWNLFCYYCCSQSLRPVVRSYEIYLRIYHVTGLTQVVNPRVTGFVRLSLFFFLVWAWTDLWSIIVAFSGHFHLLWGCNTFIIIVKMFN